MADINEYLRRILAAIKGEEVRGSIHDAIEAINEESVEAKNVAITSRDSAQNSAAVARQCEETAIQKAEEAVTAAQNAADSEENSILAYESAKDYAEQIERTIATSDQHVQDALNAASRAESAEANAKASENVASEKAEEVSETHVLVSADKEIVITKTEEAKKSAEDAKKSAEEAAAIAHIDIMDVNRLGIGKPDGDTITVDEDGTMHAKGGTEGTLDYEKLQNLPSINGVTLSGELTNTDLGIMWTGTEEQLEIDLPNIPNDCIIHTLENEKDPEPETLEGRMNIVENDIVEIRDDVSQLDSNLVKYKDFKSDSISVPANSINRCVIETNILQNKILSITVLLTPNYDWISASITNIANGTVQVILQNHFSSQLTGYVHIRVKYID